MKSGLLKGTLTKVLNSNCQYRTVRIGRFIEFRRNGEFLFLRLFVISEGNERGSGFVGKDMELFFKKNPSSSDFMQFDKIFKI